MLSEGKADKSECAHTRAQNAEGVKGPRGTWPGVVCLCEL